MLFGFSFVSYLERVNISIAAELMMPTLFLTKMQMGHIFSSFLIGYAIFRFLPGLGDIKGPRFTLAAAGLFWWDCDGIHGTYSRFRQGYYRRLFICSGAGG
jgi:MFS transporter, ACS family, glucarate transporter